MAFTDCDKRFMLRALALAQRAKGTTFPNPAVGAVIVGANGDIVGEGATGVYGGPHAERRALGVAGIRARGAVMYVTLEPCAHFGKTPPCANAIAEAGISRVVAAVKDPNPLVNGRGMRQLKKCGIDTAVGLLAKEATLVNEDFFYSVVNKRPWVSLKLALTLDGRIADYRGGSKWITSDAARREAHEIRKRHAAIAVGKNTLVSDDPKLTARCGRKTYYPARIVFGSNVNDIPPKSYFLTRAFEARTIVVCGGGKKRGIERAYGRETEIAANGKNHQNTVEIWRAGTADRLKSLGAFLKTAYDEGISSILVEGGGQLASAFLEGGFVNRAYLFYGNKIFGGGINGLQFSRGLPVAHGIRLSGVTHKSLGDNFLISGNVEDYTRSLSL